MRPSFLILFCCLYFFSTAQEKKAARYIGWRGNRIELHTITTNHQACSFILSKDSIKAFLLTGNAQMVELFTIPRRPEENFLGGFFKPGQICLFMDNGQKPGLHSWLYNMDSRLVTEHIVPFKIKDEKIIQRLSSNSHFFYFTISKKTSEFVIYKFNSESGLDTLRYAVNENLINAIKGKSSQLFSTTSRNIEKTDMEGECDIDLARCTNKLYVRNDTLYLLANNKENSTDIYSFDLTTNHLDERSVQHKPAGNYTQPVVFNSYLLRNKLYFAEASQDALLIQVVDFYSGKILNDFKAGSNEEIPFKNTPIIQEKHFGSRELGKTSQLLRKMMNGSLVIIATPDDRNNTVQVLVGSYKQVTNGNSGYMFFPGGGIVGGMAGGLAMAYFSTSGFSRDSWTKSARFKMLLNAKNDEHIAGDLSPMINERIEDYTSGTNIPTEGENLFVVDGNYCYAWYDKQERAFKVVQF